MKQVGASSTDIENIDRTLARDNIKRKRFLKFWADNKGARHLRPKSLVAWLWKHREAIAQILGFALMFLDEEPVQEDKAEPAGKPARPRTRRKKSLIGDKAPAEEAPAAVKVEDTPVDIYKPTEELSDLDEI